MAASAQAVLEELRKGIFRPLYFLQGEEPFYIDAIVDYIENHALAASERSFNQLILYGKEHKMGDIIVQARRFPMMAQHQVVIVKEAQDIPQFNEKESLALFQKYVENPVQSTILVFAHKYKKLDGRKEISKIVEKKATLVNSEKVPDYKLAEWIASYVKTQNITAGSAAVQLLADHLGNDLSRIANELEKVKILLPEKGELTKEIIHEKIGISKEFNGIEFQNALANRNMAKALQIASYFVANPKAAALIPNLALLFNFFTKVLQTSKNGKLSDADLGKLLGVNPFFVKDYRSASKRFSEIQILHILHQIRLADGYSKGIDSGNRNDEAIYKDLIFQIVRSN